MRAVEKYAVTTLAGVPPLWIQLTEHDWPPETAARLKRLTNSGGALTRPLVTRLRNLFPGADLYPMYGLTEAFRSTYLKPSLVDSHRSEEHTSELQSLMRRSYAVFCLKKTKPTDRYMRHTLTSPTTSYELSR